MLKQSTNFNDLNYYPFGMVTPGRSYSAGIGYRFGFNKIEEDDEITGRDNALNFGARLYNPRVGVFLSADTYASDQPEISPYTFAGNNPIRYIDYHGNFKMDPYFIETYPALATLLAYYFPLMEDNVYAQEAWSAVTGGTRMGFINMITYGSGPWLTVTRPSCAADNSAECEGACDNFVDGICISNAGAPFKDSNGEYDDKNDVYLNNIFLNRRWASALEEEAQAFIEDGGLESAQFNYLIFQISVLVMHEATHWGFHAVNYPEREQYGMEKGAKWELLTFGQNFTYIGGGHNVDWDGMKSYYDQSFSIKPYSNVLTHGFSLPPDMQNWKIFMEGVNPTGSERDPAILEYPPRNYTYEYPKE